MRKQLQEHVEISKGLSNRPDYTSSEGNLLHDFAGFFAYDDFAVDTLKDRDSFSKTSRCNANNICCLKDASVNLVMDI